MNRRTFLRQQAIAASLSTTAAGAAHASQAGAPRALPLPDGWAVQMQYLRPAQLEAAGRKFPVVYVPFGLIEWHGVHLPLGNDALKAHGAGVVAFASRTTPRVWIEVGGAGPLVDDLTRLRRRRRPSRRLVEVRPGDSGRRAKRAF